MPIKFPKGFARRKSAGNILDTPDEPSSSFRVLNRQEVQEHQAQNADQLNRRNGSRQSIFPSLTRKRNNSLGNGTDVSNSSVNDRHSRPANASLILSSSSGGTYNSAKSTSTTGNWSAERISNNSQSTQASSVDYDSEEEADVHRRGAVVSPAPRDIGNCAPPKLPPPPPPPQHQAPEERKPRSNTFSIAAAAGRTFSFRPKSARTSISDNRPPLIDADVPPLPPFRERATTESSNASTATPPKIELGGSLGVGEGEFSSRFSGIFDSIGGRKTPVMDSSFLPPPPVARTESEPTYARSPFGDRSSPVPLSNRLEQSPQLDSSPYFGRRPSQEAFLPYGSPSPPSRSPPLKQVQSFTRSPDGYDFDAQFVNDTVYAARVINRDQNAPPSSFKPATGLLRSTPKPPLKSSPIPNFDGQNDLINSQIPLLDNQKENSPPQRVSFEPDSTPTRLPLRERRATLINSSNKVMTPAEFEKYKAQQMHSPVVHDDTEKDDDSDNYEDEDDTERSRQMARQRRKQEATLAVYRQQMRKVTGDQPGDLPERPALTRSSRASHSAPNIFKSFGTGKLDIPGVETGNADAAETAPTAEKTSDDDDDEVPLGILQAHGFPSRSRPPTRAGATSVMSHHRPMSQMSSYPAPAGATRNNPAAGGSGGNLPVFARNLPVDPYVGASLANGSNRQSLTYGGGAPAPAQPQSQGSLPPGGLVGVIAGEERARAMRRGSPNANGTYNALPQQAMTFPPQAGQPDQPAMSPNQTPMFTPDMMPMGMGGMPMSMIPGMQQMSPGEASQVHMNNQMAQMMQMQMQWMQQMMAMQSQLQGGAMPDGQMPFMGAPGRPASILSGGSNNQLNFMNENSKNRQTMPPPRNFSTGLGAAGFAGRMPSMPSMDALALRSSSASVIGAGYAPSLAPSERSNVGQPSRYRPVNSTGEKSQTSTMATAHASMPDLTLKVELSRSPLKGVLKKTDYDVESQRHSSPLIYSNLSNASASNLSSTIRAVSKPKSYSDNPALGVDDEEDEEGWAELRKKKEARKSRWRLTRSKQEEKSPLNTGGLEGLFYDA